jgi:hypothetical protein
MQVLRHYKAKLIAMAIDARVEVVLFLTFLAKCSVFYNSGDLITSYICINGFQRNPSGAKAAALY